MTKKQRKKSFIKKLYSQFVVHCVVILVGSTLLITTPGSALSLSTNEKHQNSQSEQGPLLQERELDHEYLLEDGKDFSLDDDEENNPELNEEQDEENNPELNEEGDEDNNPELNEENDENINPELNEEDDEDNNPELNEEDDEEEEYKPKPIIGVNEKAELPEEFIDASSFFELENAIRDAKTGFNTVITITGSFDFPNTITITADRHITLQSESEMNLNHTGNDRHFRLNSGSTLTLKTGIVLDGIDNEIVNGGIHINNGGHLIMDGGTITNCRATTGGGVNVFGTLTMKEGSISYNVAESSSGGVRVQGKLEMSGGNINDNVAGQHGGGVSIMSSGNIIMSGGSIHDNKATTEPTVGQSSGYGGGIYLFPNGNFAMTGGTINNNKALLGGGFVSTGGNSHVHIEKDAVIRNNRAEISGGGIVIVGGELTMNGGLIDDNTAITENGGGISIWSGSRFWMNGGTISNNTATIYGGGVSIQDDAAFIITNGTIRDNTSEVDGGGVHIYGNGDFDMDGGEIFNNRAENHGGGVHAQGRFDMEGGKIHNNTAFDGGGIYAASVGGFSNLTMTTGEIYDNTAHNRGGGVYSSGIVRLKGASIYENKARHGGGIYAEGDFTIIDGEIRSNKAIANVPAYPEDPGGPLPNGGGVWASGTFNMGGGKIHSNEATFSGGGVYVNSRGTFIVTGGAEISDNTAYDGGGVSTSGTFTMTSGKIHNNDASRDGGGVWASGTGTFDMNDGEIHSNEAIRGGGVYSTNGSTRLIGVIVYENEALYGGGIYAEGPFSMKGGKIHSNKAIVNVPEDPEDPEDPNGPLPSGGGVWTNGIFTMEGGEICNNEASFSGGGVFVYLNGSLIATHGSEIRENKAYIGGGIQVTSEAEFNMHGGKISYNTATHAGGGIHSLGELNIFAGVISNNTASSGAGVRAVTGTLKMNGGFISHNTASHSGGGVYASVEVSMNDGEISHNTAEEYYGGGVYVDTNGEFTSEKGLKIQYNKAQVGAGVAIRGTFKMASGKISHNTAEYFGGGVYVDTNGEFTSNENLEIHNNTAEDSGGGIYALSLFNLFLDVNVDFRENEASHSYPPPLGVEYKLPEIKTRNSSIDEYSHPLNNYDIGYSETNNSLVHKLSILRSPEFGGDVVVEGETNIDHLRFMDEGLLVNLEAKPKPGYRFVKWTSSDGGSFTSETDINTVFTTPNKNTKITATFQRMILDPLNPDEEVNPVSPIDIPEAHEFISIDFVSSFDFGEKPIAFETMRYYAKPQRLLDENGQPSEERPNYIQITDNRAVNDGWTLSVTQLDQFKELGEDEGHKLTGASLTLQHAELVLVTNPELTRPGLDVELIPGKNQTLITAEPGEGKGVWIYRFGNEDNFDKGVFLEVPGDANPKATTYQTTLNWQLSSVPRNINSE